MEIAKLVLLCIASLCGYGAVVGSISAALCPEAFTLGCPPSLEHWPTLAVGAIRGALDLLIPATVAGISLGLAANIGPRPAVKTSFFPRVIPALLGLMSLMSLVGGIAGFFATRHGSYTITLPMKMALAPEKHPLLAAVKWSSLGGLLALFASAMILAAWTWRKRAQIEEMLRKR
jgi:hypothetical protein